MNNGLVPERLADQAVVLCMDSGFLQMLYGKTQRAEIIARDHEKALSEFTELTEYTLRAIDGSKAAVRYQTLKEVWQMATGKEWLG